MLSCGAWSTSIAGVLVAEEVAGEVADRDAQVLVAHVDADRERGARHERHQHRRATAALARRGVLEDSSTIPARSSSSMNADTVGRERPVSSATRRAARARMPVEGLDHAQPIHLARVEQACVLTGHGA